MKATSPFSPAIARGGPGVSVDGEDGGVGRRWGIRRWKVFEKNEPELPPVEEGWAAPETARAACAGTRCTLRATAAELGEVLEESGDEVGRLAHDFEAMARTTQGMVEGAAAIVACAEAEGLKSVSSSVRGLGEATAQFLRQRVEATADLVSAVTAETGLLRRLADLTQRQKAIVKETAVLRVLTNIEVARLGDVGSGFEYLAHELDDFAKAVSESIGELTRHTEERREEIDATRRTLQAELPRLRGESEELEARLRQALAQMETLLDQLRETPVRFQDCAAAIGQQIAGVVAAIQANDITRQQTEHVQAALGRIADDLESGGDGAAAGMTQAGLAIQSGQLRSVRTTVEGWTGQIRVCLDGIARITASEILELGRGMLGAERALETELARIEQLEEQCAAGNAKLEASLAGLSSLMQLVGEHLSRSRAVRERLQLLMFNSIVEASHLGARADGILEISNTIKRLSAAWSAITGQSGEALEEIAALVERSRAAIQAVSGEATERLRSARAETGEGLSFLQQASRCAETRGEEIQAEALALQGRMAEVAGTVARLEECFSRLTAAGEAIEREQGDGALRLPAAEREAMEERYGGDYTTELERAVLRAALSGEPLPVAQQNFAGNSVELF